MAHMVILTQLTADEVLDNAFAWLCKRRRNYPADADVWSFRQRWPAEKDRLALPSEARLSAGVAPLSVTANFFRSQMLSDAHHS
jgi:hypothetical protein